MKKVTIPRVATGLVLSLVSIGVALAQHAPATDIDPARHPNLAAAQHHILEAFEKIDEAQRANQDELGSPAERPSDSSIRPAASRRKLRYSPITIANSSF